ncbi:condensation domain-containing protein, partial [Nocardiopsis rhodophaea]|uniref:condensation domain-containing protein n=1 Tax=Nocardiopsis rhodophaea TaxID=280238 RepID=UPI0031D0B728
ERLYLEGGDLPAKTTSFAGWTQRLAEHAHSEHVTGQADYWERITESIAPLPVDRVGADTHGEACTHRLALPLEATEELLAAAHRMRARPDELVLTACARALTGWAGWNRVVVDVEGHGREPLFEDVSTARTVGWFTALHPVLLEVGGAETAEAVRTVKEALREAPDNGIGYGLLRAYTDLLPGAADAPVLFNYLGHIDQAAAADSVFRLRFDDPAWAAAAQAPENRRHHAIEINAGIHNGGLVLDLTCSREQYEDASIGELLDAVGGRLDVLTAKAEAEAAAHTSDFPLAGLDQQELDNLMAKMRGTSGDR